MAKMRGGEKLNAALADLAAKVSKPGTLKVGFLADARYPNGTSVAIVAAFNNFGTSRAPPRPFFSNMIRDKSPGWPKAMAEVLKDNDYDATKTLDIVGEGIVGQLQQAIRDYNGGPPLAASTIARKGFDKQLIDSRLMLLSVKSKVSK